MLDYDFVLEPSPKRQFDTLESLHLAICNAFSSRVIRIHASPLCCLV